MRLNLDYNYLSPEFYTAASRCWLTVCFQHPLSWFLIVHWFMSPQGPPEIRQSSCQKEPFSKPSLLFLHSFCSTQGHCHRGLSPALPSRFHCIFSVVTLQKYFLLPLQALSFPLLPSGEATSLQLFTYWKELMSQAATFRVTCLVWTCGSRQSSWLVLQCEMMRESYLLAQTL